MALVLQEVVAVEGQDASLVRLGHIGKYNIHHACRRGGGRMGRRWGKRKEE